MSGVLVLGAGGHAKVVADILLSQGVAVLGFLDDDPATWGAMRLGLPVFGGIATYADYAPGGLVLGVGSNTARQALVEKLGAPAQRLWRTAIHPRATIAASVRVGQGTVIAAGAVVNPDTILGEHTIINTGATVDHDCLVGDYAHIAPGVHLCGGVQVGPGALLGVGAVVSPGHLVGAGATIGAGAAVVGDIPPAVTAIGVPARW